MNPLTRRKALRRGDVRRRLALAFCTGLGVLIGFFGGLSGAGPAHAENPSRYTMEQVRGGAMMIPLSAQLEYGRALEATRKGDWIEAKKRLEASLELDPHYPDAHFTLARVEARNLSTDAVYHLVQGFIVMAQNFGAQSAFAVNMGVTIALVFLMASAIVWFAFGMRYLPFLAHRIAEQLRNKFNAALPRLCAYLLVLAPFALMPGYATATALLFVVTWLFMHRRERVFAFFLASAFSALMWFAPTLDRYTTVADPTSQVSLIARANCSAADPALARLIEETPTPGLEAERQTAMGMLAFRAGQQEQAVAHFLQAISRSPGTSIAYVNVGNVYYVNGQYYKALEGYRKAEQVDSTDAVGQYNLAQAYIKTLLMSESSKALSRASQFGFDVIQESFATVARANWSVYPRVYSHADLWRMAAVEGHSKNPALLSHALASAMGQSPRAAFWIVVLAMVAAIVVERTVKQRRLAFQCSNCGEITCDGCCTLDRTSVVCQACSQAVAGVSSDKVLEALMRQRRQSVIVRRRKSMKWLTAWIPGVRHVFYGRFTSGLAVAALFSLSLLQLWTRGYPLPQWQAIDLGTPLWKWIVPALGIAVSYAVAVMSRQLFELRTTRKGSKRPRVTDVQEDTASQSA